MTFSERAKAAVRAIISVFETGKAGGDYSAVAVLPDGAGISYGAHQATHRSGSLAAVVAKYLKSVPDSRLAGFLPSLEHITDGSIATAARDQTLKTLLRNAGKTAEMRAAQNHVFDKKYMQPAIKAAEGSGFKHPLTLAVIYDSKIQGSYDAVLKRVPAGLTEKQWTLRYISERRKFLANHRKEILHGTVYRPDALSKLLLLGNWNLDTPFTVRGVRITNEILGVTDESGESLVSSTGAGESPQVGATAPETPTINVEQADTVNAGTTPLDGGQKDDPPIQASQGGKKSLWATAGGSILAMFTAAKGWVDGNNMLAVVGIVCVTLLLLVWMFRQVLLDWLRMRLIADPNKLNVR